MSDWSPLVPRYEQDEVTRTWPRCYDCGKPSALLSMDLKCRDCEARAGVWVVGYLFVSIGFAGALLWWWLA